MTPFQEIMSVAVTADNRGVVIGSRVRYGEVAGVVAGIGDNNTVQFRPDGGKNQSVSATDIYTLTK